MQCCMSVVDDNIENTEKQVKLIYNSAKKYNVDIIFGGPGIELLPNVKKYIDTSFLTYKELNRLI